MSCYFIVSIYLKDPQQRTAYDEYIERVKPIVESFGGEYLVRTENIVLFTDLWKPDRVIIIKFPNRQLLDRCFSSSEYRHIQALRTSSVDTGAIIVDGV